MAAAPLAPVRLHGGPNSSVWAIPGSPPLAVKIAPRAVVAREARALRRVAALGLAPRLVTGGQGVLVTELLPGAPRDLPGLPPSDLRALGAALRRLHTSRSGSSGGAPDWPARVRSPAACRRRWAAGALADAERTGRAGLARRVIDRLPPLPPSGPRPFRLLHGDLWSRNVVWSEAGPRMVDWEYSRLGDPAEDLAYLAEMDDLGDDALGAVLEGYAVPGTGARVAAWRPLLALTAGLWYLTEEPRPDRAAALFAQALR